jgi:hypothetical protein
MVAIVVFIGTAYAKRTDSSFWGSTSILQGLWLVLSASELGLPPEANALLWQARAALLVCLLAGWGAYACPH